MRLAALALLLCLGEARALQVQALDVRREGGSYHVAVNVLIEAPQPRVQAILSDAAALPKLDPSIKAVRATPMGEGQRIESELEQCLFGFCRDLLHVQQVVAVEGEIRAETLAEPGSSFKSGAARWQLAAEGAATRLIFTARTEPDLWLPPVIGPAALMMQLREKTLASLQVLEQLARE